MIWCIPCYMGKCDECSNKELGYEMCKCEHGEKKAPSKGVKVVKRRR